MFENGKPSTAGTRGTGARWRRSETHPWSRSRRRAAAYDAGVDHVQGLVAMRTR